jgi:hypothetical protein
MPIAAAHGDCPGKRIQDCLLHRFTNSLEESIHDRRFIEQSRNQACQAAWTMGNAPANTEGNHKIAASVSQRGAGARQASDSPYTKSPQL